MPLKLVVYIFAGCMFFIVLCQKLTDFEKHLYWSEFRRWDCYKVFFFKVFNILVLFAVQYQNPPPGTCPLEVMANQFAVLVLLDVAVGVFAEFALPALYLCCCRRRLEKSEKSNDDEMPEFILSDEYVGLTYRQFLVALGFFVFPMLPALAFVASCLEYWSDKGRLLRLSKKPNRTKNTFRTVLVAFFFLITLAVLFGYPNGCVWVLSGSGGLANNGNCPIYL
jgi:hypothetical protein